jgi:hypothetical protein
MREQGDVEAEGNKGPRDQGNEEENQFHLGIGNLAGHKRGELARITAAGRTFVNR